MGHIYQILAKISRKMSIVGKWITFSKCTKLAFEFFAFNTKLPGMATLASKDFTAKWQITDRHCEWNGTIGSEIQKKY